MINRIRDFRKAKGWTLAQLAAACIPETTAQTIGRLETGTRTLSVKWMERIAAALQVEAEALVRSESTQHPQIVASLTSNGPEALAKPRDAITSTEMASNGVGNEAGNGPLMVLAIEAGAGEYRPGDHVWLRQIALESAAAAINRDVLVPRPGGRFYFGRLINREGSLVGVLPPGHGEKQQVANDPPWIAVAEMLVRKL